MMQAAAVVSSSPRPRPSIHFHAAPYGDFTFPHSYRKRKRSSNYSSEDENEISFFPEAPSSPVVSSPDDSEGDHRKKRPRITNVEYGMHGMTLQSHVSPIESSGASAAGSSVASGYQPYYDNLNNTHYVSEPELLEIDEAYMPRDVEFDSNVATPQVEEVSSPVAMPENDTKMKGASWFEPEKDRIIITDLDEYDSDEELKEPITPSEPNLYWDTDEQRYKPFTISPAYLQHFGGVPKPVTLQKPQDNMALVAYRPPIILPQRPDEVEEPISIDHYEAERPAFQKLYSKPDNTENDAMEIDD